MYTNIYLNYIFGFVIEQEQIGLAINKMDTALVPKGLKVNK